MSKPISHAIPGGSDLLDASLDMTWTRVVEGPEFTDAPQAQGRDTQRPYPGEALLHGLSKTPDRLAAIIAEPHIPGLAPAKEPEQIDMKLNGGRPFRQSHSRER